MMPRRTEEKNLAANVDLSEYSIEGTVHRDVPTIFCVGRE